MAAKKKISKKASNQKPRLVKAGPTERRVIALEEKVAKINVNLHEVMHLLRQIVEGSTQAGAQVTARLDRLVTFAGDIDAKVSTIQADNENVKRRLGGLFNG